MATTTRQSLKDFFKEGVSLKALNDGEYKATITNITFVDDAKGNGNDYVRVDLQLEDRVLNDNRFDNGFRIFCSQIKRQLDLEDQNISVPELMKEVVGKEIRVWITNPIVDTQNGPQVRRNYNYIPPITPKAAGTEEEMPF